MIPAQHLGAPKISEFRQATVPELRTGLLTPSAERIKRVFDIAVGSLLFLVSLPLAVLIAAAILMESGRPVFYAHTRIGKGGRKFRLWKFRSMVTNGDEALQRYLEQHPERAVEWLLSHKLKEDPRVTGVGRSLRKRSLDELPQFWNVLRGDMSLVGPRPIVAEEVLKQGHGFRLYSRVRPGLTGLWQVSGRNDTSYHKRVQLDSSYVCNWTPWLDLRILFRTILVILHGHGAY